MEKFLSQFFKNFPNYFIMIFLSFLSFHEGKIFSSTSCPIVSTDEIKHNSCWEIFFFQNFFPHQIQQKKVENFPKGIFPNGKCHLLFSRDLKKRSHFHFLSIFQSQQYFVVLMYLHQTLKISDFIFFKLSGLIFLHSKIFSDAIFKMIHSRITIFWIQSWDAWQHKQVFIFIFWVRHFIFQNKMNPKEYFSEESKSDHEDCSTCSEEESMSEDETPTTSDEEFIVSDEEMEEEDEFEELIEENEKLRKKNNFLKNNLKIELLIQKKCKTVGQQNLSQGEREVFARFCALFCPTSTPPLALADSLEPIFCHFGLGLNQHFYRASPLTFVNLLSKRSSTQLSSTQLPDTIDSHSLTGICHNRGGF